MKQVSELQQLWETQSCLNIYIYDHEYSASIWSVEVLLYRKDI